MLRMRRFEEAVLRLASEPWFAGHARLYVGQEATRTAIISASGERTGLPARILWITTANVREAA